jgi:hypothetical protein
MTGCGACAGGGICDLRVSEYSADPSCLDSSTGACTCCVCVATDPSDPNNGASCTTDSDCPAGWACVFVPLPNGGVGACFPPCS